MPYAYMYHLYLWNTCEYVYFYVCVITIELYYELACVLVSHAAIFSTEYYLHNNQKKIMSDTLSSLSQLIPKWWHISVPVYKDSSPGGGGGLNPSRLGQ